MKITLVGAGRVGVHLAKYFSDEEQDVFLLDNNAKHISVLESDFNLRTFRGDSTDFEDLRKAGAENADIFVAVTGNTAENLVSCATAKSMGARKTISRVEKFSYVEVGNADVIKRMGVDHVVFPDYLAAQSVINSLEHAWCKDWSEFENGAIILVSIVVEENSPICGRFLKELAAESRLLHISALRRNHTTLIPNGDDRILPSDELYITSTAEGIKKVMEITGKVQTPHIKKVILMGGSTVSELVARLSGNKFSLVIIEKDVERCREVAEKLSRLRHYLWRCERTRCVGRGRHL